MFLIYFLFDFRLFCCFLKMAFFARDILGGCCKKAKFARHFGKFTTELFRATFEEVFFDGFGCARHIWKVFWRKS